MDTLSIEHTENDVFADDVSDDALEIAARSVRLCEKSDGCYDSFLNRRSGAMNVRLCGGD